MGELIEKIKIYKEKNNILKEKQAEKFLNVPENKKKEYYDLIEEEDFFKSLYAYVNFNVVTCIGAFAYVFLRDDELRKSIRDILNGNMCCLTSENPDMYKFLIIMFVISSLFVSKTSELAECSKFNRKMFEKQEPNLQGYKYLKYLKK